MRAVLYRAFGGPEVLEFVEESTPEPGPGEVLVAVRAAGINPADGKRRSGIRSAPPPQRIGLDGAGVVAAVGEGVADWTAGDEVVLDDVAGAYATHVITTPDHLTAKPADLPWETAAALGVPVGTAYQPLRSLGVDAGMTLFVHGGASAVGQAAIQFATRWGAQVIASAGPGNQRLVRELGAIPVEYGPDLADRVRAAAPDGVDRVLDAVGPDEVLDLALGLVVDPSHVGTIVGGHRVAELGIQGWRGGNPVPLTAQELVWRHESVAEAIRLIAEDGFRIEVTRVVPLDDVVDAHRRADAGEWRGKTVLRP